MPITAPVSMASPSRGSPSARCAQLSFFSGWPGGLVPGRDGCLAAAVQAAGGEQRAGAEQEQAQGQVDARADRALGLDRVGVEGEHVQQADGQGHGHAAEQQAQEHRPRPPVLDQQQIQGQQLRVQRRQERQREELTAHRPSASIGHPPRRYADLPARCDRVAR
jgi:hypothetical protein